MQLTDAFWLINRVDFITFDWLKYRSGQSNDRYMNNGLCLSHFQKGWVVFAAKYIMPELYQTNWCVISNTRNVSRKNSKKFVYFDSLYQLHLLKQHKLVRLLYWEQLEAASLSDITPIIFNMELTHLGSESFIYF